jgi:hypothetical protein
LDNRHCEEQSDEAIQFQPRTKLDCFAALAMTEKPVTEPQIIAL